MAVLVCSSFEPLKCRWLYSSASLSVTAVVCPSVSMFQTSLHVLLTFHVSAFIGSGVSLFPKNLPISRVVPLRRRTCFTLARCLQLRVHLLSLSDCTRLGFLHGSAEAVYLSHLHVSQNFPSRLAALVALTSGFSLLSWRCFPLYDAERVDPLPPGLLCSLQIVQRAASTCPILFVQQFLVFCFDVLFVS